MLKYLHLGYDDVAKSLEIPNLLEVRKLLEELEIKEDIIEKILESLYSRDRVIIENSYLKGASDRERML
jgi:hypothetical protein